jgi:hypothetical protein
MIFKILKNIHKFIKYWGFFKNNKKYEILENFKTLKNIWHQNRQYLQNDKIMELMKI